MPHAPVVVYDRTSGDEHEDQDADAQLAQTVHRAHEAGYHVHASYTDEGVGGDVPWDERPALQQAFRACSPGTAILVREISRLTRFRPEISLSLLGGVPAAVVRRVADAAHARAVLEDVKVPGIPDLVVLGKPHWTRAGDAWQQDDEGGAIYRFLDLWTSWGEKRRAIERSALAMEELKHGRRKTKSGKPHHRPPRELQPHALEAARAALEAGSSQTHALEAYRKASGYYEVSDPQARKRRDVSRTTLMERLRAAKKPDPSET